MVVVLIGIVILAIIVYVGILAYQQRIRQQVAALADKKASLVAIPLADEVKLVSQLSLTGQSLERFETLQNDYADITKERFPRIDTQLKAIKDASRGMNLMQLRQDLAKATILVNQTDELVQTVQAKLAELQEIDKQHRQAVHDLEQKYQDLRKTLLAKNFAFGPSIDGLEERLSELEDNFDTFTKLTQTGDHERATDVLTQLQEDTASLEDLIKAIPPLYKDLTAIYPDQISELKSGYEQLTAQHYRFGDTDIPGLIQKVADQVSGNLATLADLRPADAKVINERIADQIDRLYARMQTEIDAKEPVEKNLDNVARFIAHAQNQNQSLLTELDRLSQNYTLDHQELETTRELNEQLRAIDGIYQRDVQDLTGKSATFSEVLAHQQQQEKDLKQIEEQQAQILKSVAGLADEERQARETLRQFDFKLHSLRRQVENLNLPGVPQEYLDYFFVVRDEVEQLATDMDQPQIDMEKITKQLLIIQTDLDTLGEKTDDLLDSAELAEQLLQYANRYQASHTDVAQASQQAKQLFEQDHQYAKALETIATVLDQVEPGSYKRLEDAYYQRKGKTKPRADDQSK
ncbi:septation ring formation regulator EzrA [Levilactobacillus zymae]|uniref:Septation ring formation regulator EzrA n=2 Tax=Levilactobacillus zymae TaxID=267363 RepID=A0A1Y6JXI7_9LACO|nr:septation ring formation regulator EzrA [Levilactobacillus zymae]QFR60320.1 septation ring formation regulator EzrA [Levilactobacillus zymae]GEO71231.1 septation ring formation regulator EzrA [Levilactobacillus zymae]SMS14656.1 Septation ring formation regulator EzrA [Levilactobacillus zymae]